jgi:predicted hotdog family 3-hydroxylacyl-ACP dehydratase
MSNLTLPIAAEELVPHRLPMRLVEQLIEIDEKNGTATTRVLPDNPLLNDSGNLEGVALLELIAQSYAALKVYIDRRDHKPVRQGFLVGIKKLEWFAAASIGDELRITIRTLAELDDFAVAEGDVWCGETLLAHGEVKVWIVGSSTEKDNSG